MSRVSTQPPVSLFKMPTAAGPAPHSKSQSQDRRASQPALDEEKMSEQPLARISCDSCRIRKIKCTTERPCCTNCTRKGHTCTYPTKIRRRGPDKNPGARLRSRNAASRNKAPAHGKKAAAADNASVTGSWAGVGLGVLPSAPVDGPASKSKANTSIPIRRPDLLPHQHIPNSAAQPSSQTSIPSLTPYGQSSIPSSESLVTPPDNLQDPVPGVIPFGQAGPSRGSVDSQTSYNASASATSSASPSHPYGYFPGLPDLPGLSDLTSFTAASPNNESTTGLGASIDSMMLGGEGSNPFAGGTLSGLASGLKEPQGVSGQRASTSSMDGVIDGWSGDVGQAGGLDNRRSGYLTFHVDPDGTSWAPTFGQLGTTGQLQPLEDEEICGFAYPFDPTPSSSNLIVDIPSTSSTEQGGNEVQGRSAAQREEEWKATLACFEMYVPPGNIQAAREGWWSWILDQYDTDRSVATQRVAKICGTFFTDTHIWLNFLNRDLFFHSLFSQSAASSSTRSVPSLRAAPHILLAILALTTLLQTGHTAEGQERALLFAAEAQSLLAYCVHAGSQDPSLVAAALVLTVFEIQPHVRHANSRLGSAMFLLDGIGLTVFSKRLDADDARVSTSVTGFPRARRLQGSQDQNTAIAAPVEPHLEQWAQMPSWNPNWTEGEMWKEEMRRMCWAACNLGATYSLWCVLRGEKGLSLDICHPEKFRLLFPGEAVFLDHGDVEQGKTTPWAIYQRLICIWHYVQNNDPLTAEQVEEVIREIGAVEEDLSLRVAEEGLKIYFWLAMDWVMIIRRVLNVFDKEMLLKWLRSQQFFIGTLESGLPGFPRIIHRPMHCWWYIIEAFFSLELSVPYPEMWADADKIYALAQSSIDEITTHWESQDSIRPFKSSLDAKYIKTLVERQKVLREEAEALEEAKALERAVGYVGDIEWSEVKFQCVGRGG
ncbi:hypothetical protein IAT38_008405 [Cryptococcus sp. DSM 104549]